LVSFASRGPFFLAVGASGAIFGIIGMNLAFFILNRRALGEFSRQRALLTLFIIGYNLYSGFTTPGIDNINHLGGLVAGFALGYGLSPRYQLLNCREVDTVSLLNRWWIPTLATLILAIGIPSAIYFWVWRLG
jgi:membrane associated rhomboid family serine protease